MGSWWRTMRIRQTKLPPVRSSLRELLGTAQVFAKPAESAITETFLKVFSFFQTSSANGGSACPQADGIGPVPIALRTTRSTLALQRFGLRASSLRYSFGIRHSSFDIFQIPPINSHRRFPPNNFPGRPLLRPLDSTPPSWMAMGMVRPRQHSTQQLESSRNN
jgi:hypothetical protein